MVNQVDFVINGVANLEQIKTEIAKLKASMLEIQKIPLVGATGAKVVQDLKIAQKQFDQMVLSTRAFNIETVKMSDSLERTAGLLQQGKLRIHDYFQIWRDQSKGTSKLLDDIANQQARISKSFVIPDLLKPGYAKVITNLTANIKDLGAETEAAAIKQKLMNSVIRDGTNQLINLGKNTQWAGRQLTVGLTVPLAAFSAQAAKAFNDVDKELTRMTKVYGDGLTVTSQQTIDKIRKQTITLAQELARTYGMAAQTTAQTAADLAATGLQGQQLLDATRQTMRLATLGELDQQSAMKATIALQRTFKLSSQELGDAVNYLNAVENQTSTSLADLVEALPRAGTIVQELGGNFKDLSVMMVAMREAGVPAAEAANSIKSAMASIINPSKTAREDLKKFGIDIQGITTKNAGDLVGTIEELQKALDGIDPLNRTRMIEELFGKFQFAKVAALLDNLGKAGSQTQKAFELAHASSSQLANLAAQELKQQTESVSGQWNKAIQTIKADFLPIGQQVVKVGTVILNVFSKIIETIDKMGPLKNILGVLFGGVAIVGPLLMISGIFINLIGQMAKAGNYFRMFREGLAQTGTVAGGFKNLSNFFEVIDKSTLAASQGMSDFTTSTDNTVQAFAKLNEQVIKLKDTLQVIAGNPLAFIDPKTQAAMQNFSQMSHEEMLAINPYYGKGEKIAGVERPHQYAAASLIAEYSNSPDKLSYANLQQMRDTMPDAAFKEYLGKGLSSQYTMSSTGAAAALQRKYSTDPVIYGGPSGQSKQEVFERETKRLIDIHDKILAGTFTADEKTITQLTKILGTVPTNYMSVQQNPEQLAQLHDIISQVTYSFDQFSNTQVEHLVNLNGALYASDATLEKLNLDLKSVYQQDNLTAEERANGVKAAWQAFQNNLMSELANDTAILSDLARFRASATSSIAGARNISQAALAAANIQAGIQLQAESAGGIYAKLLSRKVSQDAGILGQSLSHITSTPLTPPKTPGLASGGHVTGPGGPTDDKIPAMLSNGEYVIRASSVSKYGKGTLDAINAQRFSNGGIARFSTGTSIPVDQQEALDTYLKNPLGGHNRFSNPLKALLQRYFIPEGSVAYRALSEYDMAYIAGYQEKPNPQLELGPDWVRKYGKIPTMIPRSYATTLNGIAMPWRPNAEELITKAGLDPSTLSIKDPRAKPFLDLRPTLGIGDAYTSDHVKSVTTDLDWAKRISVEGGTGANPQKAIAKIIFDQGVKGIADIRALSQAGGNRDDPKSVEGLVSDLTKYILVAINKNAHHVTDEEHGVSNLIDEYVFRAMPNYRFGGIAKFANPNENNQPIDSHTGRPYADISHLDPSWLRGLPEGDLMGDRSRVAEDFIGPLPWEYFTAYRKTSRFGKDLVAPYPFKSRLEAYEFVQAANLKARQEFEADPTKKYSRFDEPWDVMPRTGIRRTVADPLQRALESWFGGNTGSFRKNHKFFEEKPYEQLTSLKESLSPRTLLRGVGLLGPGSPYEVPKTEEQFTDPTLQDAIFGASKSGDWLSLIGKEVGIPGLSSWSQNPKDTSVMRRFMYQFQEYAGLRGKAAVADFMPLLIEATTRPGQMGIEAFKHVKKPEFQGAPIDEEVRRTQENILMDMIGQITGVSQDIGTRAIRLHTAKNGGPISRFANGGISRFANPNETNQPVKSTEVGEAYKDPLSRFTKVDDAMRALARYIGETGTIGAYLPTDNSLYNPNNMSTSHMLNLFSTGEGAGGLDVMSSTSTERERDFILQTLESSTKSAGHMLLPSLVLQALLGKRNKGLISPSTDLSSHSLPLVKRLVDRVPEITPQHDVPEINNDMEYEDELPRSVLFPGLSKISTGEFDASGGKILLPHQIQQLGRIGREILRTGSIPSQDEAISILQNLFSQSPESAKEFFGLANGGPLGMMLGGLVNSIMAKRGGIKSKGTKDWFAEFVVPQMPGHNELYNNLFARSGRPVMLELRQSVVDKIENSEIDEIQKRRMLDLINSESGFAELKDEKLFGNILGGIISKLKPGQIGEDYSQISPSTLAMALTTIEASKRMKAIETLASALPDVEFDSAPAASGKGKRSRPKQWDEHMLPAFKKQYGGIDPRDEIYKEIHGMLQEKYGVDSETSKKAVGLSVFGRKKPYPEARAIQAGHLSTSSPLILANGGKIFGAGGPTDDKIPAYLSNGEFVMNAKSVQKYGSSFMNSINKGTAKFANGGIAGFEEGGKVVHSQSGAEMVISALEKKTGLSRESDEMKKVLQELMPQFARLTDGFKKIADGSVSVQRAFKAVKTGNEEELTTSGMIKGRAKSLLRAGGSGMRGQMAAQGLTMGISVLSQIPAVQKNQYASGAMSGAMQGAQLAGIIPGVGPIAGMAIGAAYGMINSAMQQHAQKVKEHAAVFKEATNMSATALANLGIKVHDFSNATIIAAAALGGKKTEIQTATDAYKAATDQTTIDSIQGLKDMQKSGDTAGIISAAQKKYSEAILHGADAKKAEVDVAGWLNASGINGTTLTQALDFKTSAKSVKEAFTKISDDIIIDAKVKGKTTDAANTAIGFKYGYNAAPDQGLINTISSNTYGINPGDIGALDNEYVTKYGGDVGKQIASAGTTLNPKEFQGLLKDLDPIHEALVSSKEAYTAFNDKVRETDSALADSNDKLEKLGLSHKGIMVASQLATLGLQMTDEQYRAIATDADFAAAMTQKFAYQQAAASAVTTMLSKHQQKVTNGYTNSIKALQREIDANNKSMKKIQEVMAARDKAYNKQKEQNDDALRMSGLMNDIKDAEAKGNLLAIAQAESAYNAAQADLDAKKAKEEADAKDEAKLKALEKANQKLQDRIANLQDKMQKAQSTMKDTTSAANDLQTAISGINPELFPSKEAWEAAVGKNSAVQKAMGDLGISSGELKGVLDSAWSAAKPEDYATAVDKITNAQNKLNAATIITNELNNKKSDAASKNKEALKAVATAMGLSEEQVANLKEDSARGRLAASLSAQYRASLSLATGGSVFGPGGPKSDIIPAMLSNGEYVVNAGAVSQYGVGMMDAINAKRFATGGLVPSYRFADGGTVAPALSSNAVYNISVSVDTNANPDEIAKQIMKAIERTNNSIGTSRVTGSVR